LNRPLAKVSGDRNPLLRIITIFTYYYDFLSLDNFYIRLSLALEKFAGNEYKG